jgi:hypothetical protein
VANEDLHEGREDRVLAWHAALPTTISAVSAL